MAKGDDTHSCQRYRLYILVALMSKPWSLVKNLLRMRNTEMAHEEKAFQKWEMRIYMICLKVDYKAALDIHENNVKRCNQGIEYNHATGLKISDLQ